LIGGSFSSVLGITSYWLYSESLERYGKTFTEAQINSIGLIMFGSLLTGIEYYTKDIITLQYTLSFIVVIGVGLMFALLLKHITNNKFKRPSILLFIAAAEILAVLIAVVIITGFRYKDLQFNQIYLSMNSGCTL
jgi:hypothetical protein